MFSNRRPENPIGLKWQRRVPHSHYLSVLGHLWLCLLYLNAITQTDRPAGSFWGVEKTKKAQAYSIFLRLRLDQRENHFILPPPALCMQNNKQKQYITEYSGKAWIQNPTLWHVIRTDFKNEVKVHNLRKILQDHNSHPKHKAFLEKSPGFLEGYNSDNKTQAPLNHWLYFLNFSTTHTLLAWQNVSQFPGIKSIYSSLYYSIWDS